MSTNIEQEKNKLLSQLKKYVPHLGFLLGINKSIIDFSRQFNKVREEPVYLERQNLFKDIIKEKIIQLFGRDKYDNLKINLDGYLLSNIADHHQILNHPTLLPSNIISNVDKFFSKEKADAIVTLSSGDVPPNNFFSKNGFLFHDKKVPLFSNSEREAAAYYLPKRDFNFVERLKDIHRWSEFSQPEQEFLLNEQNNISNLDFSTCNDYCDQITIINNYLWPLLFEEKMRANLPELIYVTQEEIVSKALIKLLEEDNFISAFFFDPKLRSIILNNFRGNATAWEESSERGTHFFWLKQPDGLNGLRLYFEDNKLVPSKERYKDLGFEFNKENIISKLKSREIYPNLFIIFTVLNFYAGIKPLTGFGSYVYLNLMKDIWLKTFNEIGYPDEVDHLNNLDIDSVISVQFFFKKIGDQFIGQSAHDLFADGGIKLEYLKKAVQMNFQQIFSIAMPGVYGYFCNNYIPEEEHLKMEITPNDLAAQVFDWL